MELTPWFPAEVKPVRIGVYQKDFGDGREDYQYWDGKYWHYGDNTVERTFNRARPLRVIIQRPWRGILK